MKISQLSALPDWLSLLPFSCLLTGTDRSAVALEQRDVVDATWSPGKNKTWDFVGFHGISWDFMGFHDVYMFNGI